MYPVPIINLLPTPAWPLLATMSFAGNRVPTDSVQLFGLPLLPTRIHGLSTRIHVVVEDRDCGVQAGDEAGE